VPTANQRDSGYMTLRCAGRLFQLQRSGRAGRPVRPAGWYRDSLAGRSWWPTPGRWYAAPRWPGRPRRRWRSRDADEQRDVPARQPADRQGQRRDAPDHKPDTTNATDSVYANGGAQSLLKLTPSGKGYIGAITLAVKG
jgi:hypothetical protein